MNEVGLPDSSEPEAAEAQGRIDHAVAQIDYALTDSRIEGAAAAWLRTIRSGLIGGEGD